MSEQVYNEKNQDYYKLIRKIFKWIILSIAMAIPIGIVVGLYNMILKAVNSYRNEYEYLVYFLPIAGLIITFMYLKTKRNVYSGENLLKSEVQSEAKDIPFYMTFVVFIGSLLTTICGGAAGKEGSVVAMWGTLGDFIARKFKLSDDEQRTLVICGVGSAFEVIYDVPFVGAALGSWIAKFINIPLASCAALGMIGFFCSATSLPITAIAMSLEYFGGEEMVAIIIVMTVSYIISGFYDILTKRKIPEGKGKIFEGKVHKNK